MLLTFTPSFVTLNYYLWIDSFYVNTFIPYIFTVLYKPGKSTLFSQNAFSSIFEAAMYYYLSNIKTSNYCMTCQVMFETYGIPPLFFDSIKLLPFGGIIRSGICFFHINLSPQYQTDIEQYILSPKFVNDLTLVRQYLLEIKVEPIYLKSFEPSKVINLDQLIEQEIISQSFEQNILRDSFKVHQRSVNNSFSHSLCLTLFFMPFILVPIQFSDFLKQNCLNYTSNSFDLSGRQSLILTLLYWYYNGNVINWKPTPTQKVHFKIEPLKQADSIKNKFHQRNEDFVVDNSLNKRVLTKQIIPKDDEFSSEYFISLMKKVFSFLQNNPDLKSQILTS